VDETGVAYKQPDQLQTWFEDDRLRAIAVILQAQSEEVYLVGGAVRDGLLGQVKASPDLDLAVPAAALQVAKRLADQLKAAYYPVDPERGVGRVVLPDQTHIDIAGYRGRSLQEDLSLRDFTINAMALRLDLDNPRIIDPLSGQVDLVQRTIRATSEAAMRDDPLRTVRAVRLAVQLGFTITPETEGWISACAERIESVSAERLRDEMLKLLQVDRPGQAVAILKQVGLLDYILPEALAMVGVPQPPPHHLPVFEHTLRVLDWTSLATLADERLAFLKPLQGPLQTYFQTDLPGNLPRASLMPLAALLHDIGKPQTFSQAEGGRIRFLEHPQVGAEIAARIMNRWRLSTQARRFVKTIVRYHMRPLHLSRQKSVSKRAIHRFLTATGEAAPALALFSLMDHLGTFAPNTGQAEWARLSEVVFRLCQSYFTPKPALLLTGREVIHHLGISPGPTVGTILRALKEAQAVGEVQSRQEALAFIERLEVH